MYRRQVVEVGLDLGETLLVAGRLDGSLDCATRCRTAAPFDERAHRLAIAANLHRRDRAGVDDAVRSLHRALAELEVEPEPATAMLLRRAAEVHGAALPSELVPTP